MARKGWRETIMWEQFTSRAKYVVAGARKEAARLRSDWVNPEHILLGLCREPECTAARALERLGTDVESLVTGLERQIQPGTANIGTEYISFAPEGKRVLKLSVEEARRLNHNYIGTEHLLLGLLREGKSIAAKILAEKQIDAERVVAEIHHPFHSVALSQYRTAESVPSAPERPDPGRASTTADGRRRFTSTIRKALEIARDEVAKEKEAAIRCGAHEDAGWWRLKECDIIALLDESAGSPSQRPEPAKGRRSGAGKTKTNR